MNKDDLSDDLVSAAMTDSSSQGFNPSTSAQGTRPGVVSGPIPPAPSRNPRPSSTQGGTTVNNELLPSESELEAVANDVTSNSVATQSTIREILDLLRARRPSANPKDLFSLAWACYHNGSSRYTNLATDAPCGMSHAELKDLVEEFCTLRQFCGFYAKTCYVTGKQQNKPPANWARKGFQDDSKFAAFDFFNAVSSDSAPNPPGGMRFKPTQAEILGHSLNAKMSIIESRKSSNMVSTRADVIAQQQIHEPPKPLMLTF
uniref:CP n=1 Tax=Garlic virus C TaxID=12431 RepID=A0A6M2YTL4_9VIRU|nr:CP [Garlic virus C]QED43327.1 CP [Garlic virus C]